MPTSDVLAKRSRIATLVIVSLGLFMVVLDNLVVNVALATIHRDLGASMQSLEWIVNAYVLAYAVLLLTGSALGDRFGRKRMFIAGIALFTVASAGSALAPTTGALIAARALQGVGAAIVTPLTLTLLADAFPPERRGLALGVWSGISGIAVALGPLVGGADDPDRLLALDLLDQRAGRTGAGTGGGAALEGELWPRTRARPARPCALSMLACSDSIFGLIRAQTLGWTAPEVLISLAAGVLLLIGFVAPGAAHRRSDAADGVLQAPQLRRHQRRVAVDVLRHVRLDLLHEPVPAERGRQHAVRGRPEAAGMDRSDDAGRTRRGLLLGAVRRRVCS